MNKFDNKIPGPILWTDDGFNLGKLLDEQAQTIKVQRAVALELIRDKVIQKAAFIKERKELKAEMRTIRKENAKVSQEVEILIRVKDEIISDLRRELFELSGENNKWGEIDFDNKNAPGD